MSDILQEKRTTGLQVEALFDGVFKTAFNAAMANVINQMIGGGKTPEELFMLQAKIEAYGEIKGELASMVEDGKRAENELKILEETRNG